MHARLVEHDMREFGEPVFDILNPAVPDDCLSRNIVRFPEGCLVNPIGLLCDALAEAEGFKHLHRPAGNAVGLAEKQGARFLIDDPGANVGKGCQLRRQGQTGRPAADDEDINVLGKRGRVGRGLVGLGRIRDFRIAGSEAVEMELHDATFPGLFWLRISRPAELSLLRTAPFRAFAGFAEARNPYRC